jgi:transposase-like protein
LGISCDGPTGSGLNVAEGRRPVARIGLALSVIENWQAVIRHAGLDLVAENARLRRQNERLRTEREILKKRCAFFRKRRDERRP